jgi:hypothetical protein
MNDQLLNLYNSKWGDLCSAMQPILADNTLELKPTCPLLLTIDNEDEFNNGEIRIMVFGQETNSWYNELFYSLQDPIMTVLLMTTLANSKNKHLPHFQTDKFLK